MHPVVKISYLLLQCAAFCIDLAQFECWLRQATNQMRQISLYMQLRIGPRTACSMDSYMILWFLSQWLAHLFLQCTVFCIDLAQFECWLKASHKVDSLLHVAIMIGQGIVCSMDSYRFPSQWLVAHLFLQCTVFCIDLAQFECLTKTSHKVDQPLHVANDRPHVYSLQYGFLYDFMVRFRLHCKMNFKKIL